MAKRRTAGSATCQDGRWFAICTVERGKRHGKRKWIPIPLQPGETLTEDEAKAIAADMQAEYDAGRDPTVRYAAMPDEAVDSLVPGFCDAWAAKLTHDSGPKDRAQLARYLPKSPLARMQVSKLRPMHAVAFIKWMEAQPSARGGTLAPRTIRNCCDALRRALDSAVIAELLAANPFNPVKGQLPEIEDKNPLARETWEYAWSEIATLVYDERIPADRRLLNALRFGTGARISELAVTRWRDWERDVDPLSRLNIRRARKSVSRKEGTTKTRAVKRVPLVPALHALLAAWHDRGWREHYGRDPTPDDFVAPTGGRLDGKLLPRHENKANAQFKADCKRVGVRVLSQHTARHTWVTRVQDDGADGAIAQWVTHAPPKSAWNGYTRAQWTRLCAEVGKLRFPALGVGLALVPPGGETERAAEPAALAVVGARGFEALSVCATNSDACDFAGSASSEDARLRSFDPLALALPTPSDRLGVHFGPLFGTLEWSSLHHGDGS
jgi:integrase